MNAATLAILGASLLGSVHCAAMCGGFVCFYAGSNGAGTANGARSPLHAHAMYNIGRLAAYVTLGAIAGVLGAHVTHMGTLVGIARGATVLAGALMVGWAITTIAAYNGVHVATFRTPELWTKSVGSVLRRLAGQAPAVRAAMTGLLTGLIPCGWLYVFVATAGGTGSATSGMLVMATFWLGTVPALVAVGIGAQKLLAPFRARLPQFSAATVLVIGLLAITGRVAFTHHAH